MSGFLTPPAFTPNPGPITVGPNGSVLTVVNSEPVFAAGGGVALPSRFALAAAAGASNNVNPGVGFPGGTNFRLIVTLGAGNANWTGLVAGVDGQLGFLYNNDAANSLTLNNSNAGSLASARFVGRNNQDAFLPAQTGMWVLYDATLAKWVMV